METEPALVGTDGVVVLYPVPEVDLHIALVIHPGYLKGEDTVRLNKPLKNTCLCKPGVLIVNFLDGLKDLLDCLMIF